MKFEGKIVNGKPIIKPIIERKENGDIIVHVPSLSLINKFTGGENGKRNIQQIQSESNEQRS